MLNEAVRQLSGPWKESKSRKLPVFNLRDGWLVFEKGGMI